MAGSCYPPILKENLERIFYCGNEVVIYYVIKKWRYINNLLTFALDAGRFADAFAPLLYSS